MNKTTALKTPSPHNRVAKKTASSDDYEKYRKEFFGAVLDMSWQMALVVLIPIVGGFELDQKLNTLPALTFVGLLMAMAGMFLIVRRQLILFSPDSGEEKEPKR